MRQDVCATAAALAALALVLVVPASRACPRSCNCYQANEVHCTFRSLLAVPGGLPARTQRINLGFNSISRIPERSLAGLKRAELLMLHGNDLHRIPDGVFRDMKSLQVLKLSYNKLKEISSSRVFSGLTSLLRLHLDHNLLQHLHPQALLQLPSLRLLRLQGNRLHQLHPHSLCTLSFLNTYHYSTLRHLDLSNNSLTTLSREVLETAPLMETLVLQANPWSCDCRMSWLLGWSVAHPGLMKCPEGPQCPVCSSPSFLQGRGLLQQTDLSCTSPIISSPGRDLPSGSDLGETPPAEAFREPLGAASLGLSDQQGNSVELSCSISHSTDYPDITPPPDFSSSSSAPLPLALSISLSLDCPVESRGYESLWRILAYYSEIAVRLEREIMLSTAPALTYRYRQAGETEGYYHTGVTASVKVKPNWLLQPAISIQLNRPHSTRHQVQLILSTRVSARPDSISHTESFSSLTSNSSLHPWVRISTYHTATAVAAVTGSRIELSCPVISSGNHTIQWILPDGSKLIPPYSSPDGRFRVTESGLLLQRTQFSDAGIYHCVARAGKDVDVLRLRLAVEESSAPPPGEQVGPVVTGFVGEPVRVPCNVSGSPTPEISWVLPDGNIVKRGLGVSDGIIIDSNGSLSLPHPSLNDIGHYRCTAVNQIGVDSLSMRLDLNPRPAPSLRTFFRSGPQSASGRSTRIRAPLLRETMLEEGSGAEEEDGEKLPIINRRGPRPNGPPINGRFPTGHPRRRGHVRGGRPRQGGLPSPTFELRRNRFDGRQRGSTTNQRIDPQKWADLLAKIRQRTTLNTTSQPTIEAEPTSQPSGREKSREAERDEGDGDSGKEKEDVTSDIKRGVEGGEERENKREGEVEVGVEAETEGSSIDDAGLEEEGLQPVIQVNMDTQTNKGIKTNTFSNTERGAGKEKDTKADKQKGKSTEISGQDRENEAVTQTQTVANTVTQTASVTSKPLSRTNEIGPERGGGQGRQPNPSPSAAGFHNHRQRVPANLLPNSRPQSPWNARRRVGQRRRIINRNRGRPLAPPQPLPDPTNPRSQTVTPDTNSNQIDTLTTSLPGMVSTRIDPIRAPSANPNRLESDLLSPTLSGVSPSSLPHYQTAPASSPSSVPLSSVILPSVSLSPSSAIPIRTDTLNRSFNTPDRVESTSSPPKTQMPVHPRTTMPHTQAIQTQGRTSSSKNTDITTSRHVEEDSKGSVSSTSHASINFSAYPPYPISSTATHSTNEETPSTTPVAITNTRSTSSTRSNPTTTATPPTTFRSPTLSTSTTTTVKTTSPNTSSTASTTTTTTTTSTAITNSQDARSYKLTTTPHTTTVSTTSATIPTTTKTTTTPTTTTTTPSTTAAASTTTSTTTPTTSPPLSEAHTTTASSSSRESSSKRPSPGRVDPRERPVPGVLNQRRTGLDWKNPAANSIPDSHSGRPLPPSSPALPASPGGSGGNPVPTHPLGSPKVPVVRSRPRIADPHIRTVSVPAESTAKLACEAQGHPTPAITWTKVSTGAVMSASLRAERFEVLPNGTFVIHNVQLQDRGTYICSAQSFLGRDRMLTTLEVWSRPPRMQSANYRETTIHQGGEIRLDCQAEGIPAPLLSWVLPDRSVITSNSSRSRVTMHANGTLHLSVTLPSDRGVYRCVASNLAGAASASVRVHISSLPPMMHQPREERLVLAPGMPLYALCSARGAPPPTLRWRTPDGTLLRPSQFLHGNLFVLPNGTLHIRKLGPKDSGSYECTAGNAVGVVKRTVRVVLKGSAEDNGWAVGRAGDLGERATGEAVSAVTQAPSATHPRKGSAPSLQLHPFNRSRTSLLSPNSPLSSPLPEPPSSPKPLHRNNTGASQRKSSPLSPSNPLSPSIPTNKTKVPLPVLNNTRVHSSSPADKIQLPPSYPSAPGSNLSKAHIISTSPSVTTIHHGGNLLLHCSVSGNPTPTVIWRTPLRKLVDMHFSFDQRLKVHHNGSLLVHTVTERDAGDYLCIARNKVSDDYRLLRVTVATKPAKIDPKQPSNKMVSFGGSLKVDCLASGLPDPAVTWSLPDGTMVNSVLRGEDQGRARRLTVFDNGTLLVPAVGMGEEGEYTCYAKNPGGQDTMKVKVHVMLTSAPAFTDGLSYQIIKVRQGATVALRCHAAGDPTPTVTWFTPNNRVIPRSSGSRYFSERVVVLSDGAMEVRLAQKGDAGNYTCRAYNTAGERSRVVGLEVEAFNNGHSGRVSNGRGSGSNGHSGAFYQHGTTNGVISKFGSNGVGSSSSTNSRVINTIPSYNMNLTNSGLKPASGADSSVGVNRPINGVLARLGNGVISVGVSGASNIAIKPGDIGLNRYRGISSSSISAGNNPVAIGEVGEGGIARNSNNEVVSGRNGNYTNSGIVNGKTSGATSNTGVISSSASSSGAGTGIARGNVLSSNTGWTNGGTHFHGRFHANGGSTSHQGVVTSVKQRAVKGQTVILHCPSHGSPLPRLSWLLPGNGILPAPYYGSRLTVHRNGSLELRGVRASDGGTLVCVVRGDRGETRIQVELTVSDAKEDPAAERPAPEGPVSVGPPHAGDPQTVRGSVGSSIPRPPLPETLQPRSTVTEKPPQRSPLLLNPQRPVGLPLRPESPASEPVSGKQQPVVSTKTGSLVSIINGENLRLSCPAPQNPGQTRGTLSWTLPRGEVLSRGESADSGKYSVLDDGTLVVQQATVFDRGSYSCRSTSHDSSAALVVTVPVIVIAYPPRITMGPSPVTYTRPGVAVELPCLTIATPRATVTWETPDLSQLRVTDQARIYGNRYLSAQGSLVIQNPSSRDTGFYRCTAKNVIGADTKATYLHVV